MYTIGQCGPVLGTNVFPPSEKPLYRKGMWISAAMCLMVAVLAVGLSLWLRWENMKLDREGVPYPEEIVDGDDDEEGREQRRSRAQARHVW
jgi:hypothetical protein